MLPLPDWLLSFSSKRLYHNWWYIFPGSKMSAWYFVPIYVYGEFEHFDFLIQEKGTE